MKKLLAIAIAALLMAPIASAQQGNLPKPVQKLPAYPPVVCVAPNWATESCEERADDPWSLKPLWKFLKMLDESWLATADKWDKPRPWNGAWPNHVTVLYHEPGGELRKNVKRWQELANSKDDVEIRGTCVSGCTMIMAYVPKARICFGGNASLWFHRAQVQYENGVLVPDYATTAWMVSQYPPDIRRWIMDKGGPANMTVRDFWELSAGDLWEMGYRKCAGPRRRWRQG